MQYSNYNYMRPVASYAQRRPPAPNQGIQAPQSWWNRNFGPSSATGQNAQNLVGMAQGVGNAINVARAANPFGGGGPDYAALIGGDYGVQQAETDMAARMGRARGDFQSQLRQMLVDLGVSDKSKLGGLGQYIDQDTLNAAAANKYSQTAQIGQQEAAANAQNQANLAARGILTSGQMTTNLENVTAQAEQGRYSALRDFLSGGAQGLTQLADLQDQLAQGVAQARAAAADRAAQEYYWQSMMGGGGAGAGGAGGAGWLAPTGNYGPTGMAGGALGALGRVNPARGQSAYDIWRQEHGV